jgi:hypothetical protein
MSHRRPVIEELRRPQGAYELMAGLMAYLRADASRDPAPGLSRGHSLLVGERCLKCHRYRGEGGRIADELTRHNPGYQSPVAWASAVWAHAPRMAEEARRMGVLYPRFRGEEMGNLVGLLRSTAKAP